MSVSSNPAHPLTSMLKAITVSCQNPQPEHLNYLFAQFTTFCIVYLCMRLCLPASLLRIPLVPSHSDFLILWILAQSLLPQSPSKNTHTGQISVLLTITVPCICSWYLSQLQFMFSCMITSLMSASTSISFSAIKVSTISFLSLRCTHY